MSAALLVAGFALGLVGASALGWLMLRAEERREDAAWERARREVWASRPDAVVLSLEDARRRRALR